MKSQIEYYENANPLKKIIGDKLSYYYTDVTNTKFLASNLIYIDIRSAFPTICNIIFKDRIEFINELNNKKDKLSKNIFIATNLNTEELQTLNYLCKVLILNYTIKNYEIVNILEYIKDGILIDGYKKDIFNIENIEFKITNFKYYSRFSKTSFYYSNELIIKGLFKNPPPYLLNILNLIFKLDLYNKKFNSLTTIYSKDFFNIIRLNSINDLLNFYYKFDKKYIITNENSKSENISKFNPENVLRFFIFPILSLFRNL